MLQTTFHCDFNPVERGIQYADQMRKSKRTQILMQKRLKLKSSYQDHHSFACDVTPIDYLHLCSLGQDFELALPGLANFLKDEQKVQDYMRYLSVKQLNELASLMVGQLQVKEAREHCLVILINLTYCSTNTSIYLADVLQAMPALLQYIDEYPSDVAWLFSHLLSDCSAQKCMHLQKERFLQRIAPHLETDYCNVARAARFYIQKISDKSQELMQDVQKFVNQIWQMYLSGQKDDQGLLIIREAVVKSLLFELPSDLGNHVYGPCQLNGIISEICCKAHLPLHDCQQLVSHWQGLHYRK